MSLCGEWVVRSAGVHRAACGCASGLRGRSEVLGKGVLLCGGGRRSSAGMGCEVGGECIAQPAGVRRGCVGGGSARGGRVAVRGRAKVFGGEWVVRSAGNASHSLRVCVGLRGGRKCSGRACRCAGASEGLRRGMGCEGGEECIVAGRGSGSVRGGSGSARRGRVAVRGRAEVFGGEWVVRSAGLTHIRRSSSTRARVLLYIRPPCPRREIAAMGPKDAPASTHRPRRLPHPPRPRLHFRARVHTSPAKPSAPAPSVFAFSYPRSHFPRIAFRGPRGAIGLPQQQLSTMGYPRKSYPHRCSPPCAKRSRPRACARVYNNISFARRPLPGSVRAAPEKSPRRCGTVARTAVRRVGEGKAKADAPSRSAEQCRLRAE